MRFSVIIPVYNVEPYLRDCLDSMLNQTCSDWEAVCVNDGSTDGSAAILEEYANKDHRFRMVTQANGGLSSARNSGVDVSIGEYLLFLDSDDWLESNALETIGKALEGEDLLCFSGRRFMESTKTYNAPDDLAEKTYGSGMDYYNENALAHRDFAFVCVVLRAYRRDFLVNNGLRFKEGIYHEDNLFTPMVCSQAKSVRVINACLYDYRIRANSITDGNQEKRNSDMMFIANELALFFTAKLGFDKTVVYRAITHHYQRVFFETPQDKRREMKSKCNWRLYRTVSRTKLRHKYNYFKNRWF